MMFFSIIGSLLLLFASFRLGGTVAFDIPGFGRILEMRPIVLAVFILVIFWSYGIIAAFLRKIFRFFAGKPDHEKGLDHLQLALSGILLKDRRLTAKSVQKARKCLGDIPMISWLEGQMMLLNDDPHKAKAIFYELSAKEKQTMLGAYSICTMAIKEGSNSDAINAIDTIIKAYPQTYDLIFQAISLSIKEQNFLRAKKYIPAIKNTEKAEIVEAIIYAEEGAKTDNQDLMKKAFKIAPELSVNAINYAESLKNEGSYRKARKVLLKSFELIQVPEVYEKYVKCSSKISEESVAELSEKIAKEVPDSWLAQCKLSDDPDETLQNVQSFWKCRHCGCESKKWTAVCEECGWIGECRYQERGIGECLPDTPKIALQN